MAEIENSKDLISVLWSGADILRSKMDANEYKDYLLGIVFYKYLSDSFLIKVYDLLYDEGFEYVNKSVVVNFYQITNIKNNCVKFADGNYIEISRSRRNIIMDKFFEAVK